jgi:hypothetical protein
MLAATVHATDGPTRRWGDGGVARIAPDERSDGVDHLKLKTVIIVFSVFFENREQDRSPGTMPGTLGASAAACATPNPT